MKEQEINERLRVVNEEITRLIGMPNTATVKGITASYSGRISELQVEREKLLSLRAKILANRVGKSAMQGPDLQVK